MKRAARRLCSRAGMTLVETLMAVLIITLLTSVIFIGSQAAARVTVQDTFAAESQSVADTINRALSDVLRYAEDITTDSTGRVTAYTSSEYGISDGSLRVGTGSEDAGHIYLVYGSAGSADNLPLLSNLSYSGLMVVPEDYTPGSGADISGFDLRYSDGVFAGSYRLYDSAHHLLSDSYEFSFRAVNG